MISTNIKSFFIRKAEREDAPLILAFIRDLAAYEKLSHEVVATEALLEETLFGERRTAEVLIGEYQGSPAAFALFFHNYSTFLGRPGIYLEDLFVKPPLRGKDWADVCLPTWGTLPAKEAAAVWNGGCWIGTRRP